MLAKLPPQTVRNDSQNVHDHSLQNIGNQILKKLESNSDYDTNRACVLSLVNESRYPHIQRVLGTLVGDTKHSRFDKTEQEVFNAVWDRVRNNKDMTEMFLDNVNSCVEDEHVVCSTGKIMRMLSTLDVVDDETPDLKPVWVIKQEIMGSISNAINKLSPEDKRRYEGDDNEEIRDRLRAHILQLCKETYKEVIQDEVLDNIMKEYLEYV